MMGCPSQVAMNSRVSIWVEKVPGSQHRYKKEVVTIQLMRLKFNYYVKFLFRCVRQRLGPHLDVSASTPLVRVSWIFEEALHKIHLEYKYK